MRPHILALALSSMSLGASAQGWSVSRYAASPSAEDLNATERALVTPHLRVGGLLAVDWARSLAGLPIEQRVTAQLAATVGLFDRVQLGVVMPVVLTQEISMAGSTLAPGDLRVDARVRVLGPARRGSGRLALAATLPLPTGRGGAYAGDGAVGVVPRLIFELTNARDLVFAANLGLAVRPGWENQLMARAGVTIPLLPRVLVTLESRRRAESICDWLVGRGIARPRLVARGYGRTRPLVDNATPAGRAMNRRVEFVVLERTPPATR